MTTVSAMLEEKESGIWSISETQSVYQAIKMMKDREVGALPVLNANGQLSGIISERDYARKVILQNKSSKETQVSDIMTTEVVSVAADTSVDICMGLMSQHKIRHLPVVNGEALVGIITIGDLLKFIIREQSTVIEELESYIMEEEGGEG